MFLLGRTETVHVASRHSKNWVKVMDDNMVESKVKTDLLRKSIKHQTQMRLDATIGNGCDRHLFALMCASREMGLDFPKIFAEKVAQNIHVTLEVLSSMYELDLFQTWQMPFLLSTSQTPTAVYDYGADGNYETLCGGFGPTHPDGYGICYDIYGDDLRTSTATKTQALF